MYGTKHITNDHLYSDCSEIFHDISSKLSENPINVVFNFSLESSRLRGVLMHVLSLR